jgi:hypothetical protein
MTYREMYVAYCGLLGMVMAWGEWCGHLERCVLLGSEWLTGNGCDFLKISVASGNGCRFLKTGMAYWEWKWLTGNGCVLLRICKAYFVFHWE